MYQSKSAGKLYLIKMGGSLLPFPPSLPIPHNFTSIVELIKNM